MPFTKSLSVINEKMPVKAEVVLASSETSLNISGNSSNNQFMVSVSILAFKTDVKLLSSSTDSLRLI